MLCLVEIFSCDCDKSWWIYSFWIFLLEILSCSIALVCGNFPVCGCDDSWRIYSFRHSSFLEILSWSNVLVRKFFQFVIAMSHDEFIILEFFPDRNLILKECFGVGGFPVRGCNELWRIYSFGHSSLLEILSWRDALVWEYFLFNSCDESWWIYSFRSAFFKEFYRETMLWCGRFSSS